MTNNVEIFSDLITDSLDGDWGKSEQYEGYAACRVIRGADFPLVRLGSLSDVPIRYLPRGSLERRTLQPNDIIIETAGGARGRPTGRTIFVTNRLFNASDLPLTCASFCRFIRIDSSVADPGYVFWYLQYLYSKGEMWSHQVQHTGLARFQYTRFARSVKIPLHDFRIQQDIARVLGLIDDRIVISHQISQKLEQLADTLFKLWFVDFEFPNQEGRPFKSSGGEMVYNDVFKKEVPKGWKVGRIGDLLDNIKEPLRPGEELRGRAYVPIDHLPMKRLGLDSYLPFTEAKSSLIAFEQDDILVGAMRVYFHRVVLAPFAGITRTTSFVLRPRDKEHLSYCLLLLNLDSTISYASAHSKGTTMPYATWGGSLEDMEILIPEAEILCNFNKILYPILMRIRDSLFERITLTQIRDSLLPGLMSEKISLQLEDR